MITFDQNTLLALLPVAGTALLAMLVVIADIAWPNRDRLIVSLAAGGIVVLMAVTVVVGPVSFSGNHIGVLTAPVEVFGGAYVRDSMTVLLDLLMLSIALLTVLFGPDYLRPRNLPIAEFTAMLLFAITGATEA